MNSTHDPSSDSDQSEDDRQDNEGFISKKSDNTDQKCGCEKCMSRWERIVYRMWNKGLYPIRYYLRTFPPVLWKSEINHAIEDKCESYSECYFECPYFIAIVFFLYSSEPESNENKPSPEDNQFSGNLDVSSIFG